MNDHVTGLAYLQRGWEVVGEGEASIVVEAPGFKKSWREAEAW